MNAAIIPSLEAQAWQAHAPVTQRLARAAVILLICAAVTAPVVQLGSSLPWFKAEQVLLPVVLAVYLWLMLAGFARTIAFNPMFVVGGLFSAAIIISTWYGAQVLEHKVGLSDLYEIPKPWFPVAFFTLTYEAELSEESLRRLFYWFGIAILGVCAYGWAQWANLGITRTLNAYYSGGQHIEGALLKYRRVYATMGNANFLGELLTWSVVALTMCVLFRVGNRARNTGLAFACLITLAMTGSRYALLTTFTGLVLLFLMASKRNGGRNTPRIALFLLLIFFALAASLVATSNQATLDRYEALRNPLTVDSLRDRLDDVWGFTANVIMESPFLGQGGYKSIVAQGFFTDSEYLDILRNFGVLGFLPYLGLFLVPLVLCIKGLRELRFASPFLEERMPATLVTLRLSTIMVITAMLMNIGMSTYWNGMVQGFLWMWLGLGARAAKTISGATR